jgi:hypothetical protein
MSLVSGHITREGAIVVVLVGVSKNRQTVLEKHRLPVPQRIPVNAQLDTGSFASGFLPTVFQSLGIKPIGIVSVRTPSTKPGQPFPCDEYDVSVTFLAGITPVTIPSVHAIASDDFDTHEDGVHAILGRDILDRCTLSYCGPDRTFQLRCRNIGPISAKLQRTKVVSRLRETNRFLPRDLLKNKKLRRRVCE